MTFLDDTLDTDHIAAGYEAGVLTLRIRRPDPPSIRTPGSLADLEAMLHDRNTRGAQRSEGVLSVRWGR